MMLGPLNFSQGFIVTGEPARPVGDLGMACGKVQEGCGEVGGNWRISSYGCQVSIYPSEANVLLCQSRRASNTVSSEFICTF